MVPTTITAILMDCSGGFTKLGSMEFRSPAAWDSMTIWRSITCRGHLLGSLMYSKAEKKLFQWPTA
ncbi:hypothetical protein D3C81_2169860 [compost metagenome]